MPPPHLCLEVVCKKGRPIFGSLWFIGCNRNKSVHFDCLLHPGGRGLLREVWTGGFDWLDNVEQRPRAENTSPQERLYRDHSSPREFGERRRFTQRLSGFFVPPLTSLYTFSIRSDDQSRLYLSPNMSAEHKKLIANAPQHTRHSWTFFSTQTANPVLLEAGKAYYIESVLNQFSYGWDIGISAKIHNLSWNSYPFNGDNEVQRINISSLVVKEEHVSNSMLEWLTKTLMVSAHKIKLSRN